MQPSITDQAKIDESGTTISSAMSASEIIDLLANHECFDITDQVDLAKCERIPIASGGFGDIYRGTLSGGQKVAIKCARLYFQRGDTKGHKILKQSARELYTWSRLEHENVLELLGLAQFQDRIAMVSPWMDNGTLLQYIKHNPAADRYQLCVGISQGISYLHQNEIIHGDIKSANVLISDKGVVKIADFGCSELKTSTLCFTTTSALKLSIRWAAPEILDGPVLRSEEADVYALGMTLLEAVTGMAPFSNLQDRAVYIAVVMQRQIPKRPKTFPSFSPGEGDELWSVIEDACAYSPWERPSSMEIQHRVHDIGERNGQTPSDQPVIGFSTSAAANALEHEDDFESDESDGYDEHDEYDEYTGFDGYVEPPSDSRSSNGGGSLPPSMQTMNMQGIPVPPKLPFPPETTQRARLLVESLSREIEQTRGGQYPRCDVPEIQRVRMHEVVVAAHPLALEFERTASLHFMLFNNHQDTKQLLDQAALLREQHRILQSGQLNYIMTIDDVGLVQNSLRLAIDAVKAGYAQRVKQHQDLVLAMSQG